MNSLHTFVICAYGESPYLDLCLKSVLEQNLKSEVIIATSTFNDYIQSMAIEYSVELHVNPEPSSISGDWNFALSCAKTKYVTLAHQDDIYLPNYTYEIIKLMEDAKHPLIAFSNYAEIRSENRVVETNRLLSIKRLMLFPLSKKRLSSSIIARRGILAFGNSICCPSVCFCMDNLTMPLFNDDMRCDLDWNAWERLSRLSGDFLYCKSILMNHRIHENSETSALIADNTRTKEDLLMFRKFWPRIVAYCINSVYSMSQSSNDNN